MTKAASTKTVTIISLWTRRRRGKEATHRYDVQVSLEPEIEEMLESAYALTNMDGRPMGRVFDATTSGDLMVLDGLNYLVATVGFRRLTDAEAAQELMIADGLGWGEWSLRTLKEELQAGVPIGSAPKPTS